MLHQKRINDERGILVPCVPNRGRGKLKRVYLERSEASLGCGHSNNLSLMAFVLI